MADLLVTLGLWMLGPSLGVTIVSGQAETAHEHVNLQTMLKQMLAGYAGMLPAAAYLLVRVSAAMEGGLKGLGLVPFPVGVTIRRAVLVLIAIFPILIAVSTLLEAILNALGHPTPLIAHETLDVLVGQPSSPAWWGVVLTVVLLAPLFEELIFRGMMQTTLLQLGGGRRWPAIAYTSLFFALIHSGIATPHALPMLYILSLALGWAYERWGSLWVPILVHVLFNGVQIALAMTVERSP